MARNEHNPRRRRLRLLVGAAGLLAALGGSLIAAPAAPADPGSQPVTRWVSRHAVPLRTVDPDAPLDDLAPLQRSIGGASVVGLGESVHGAAQETALKVRTLRLLVERMGFRTLAWEEDWTTGTLLNDYIQGRSDDLDAILPRMTGQWQSRQTADLLRWLRRYNAGHAGKVRFVGVEYYYTGPEAYDAVEASPGSLPAAWRNCAGTATRSAPTPRPCSSGSTTTWPRPTSSPSSTTPTRSTGSSPASPIGPGTAPTRSRCTTRARSCPSTSTMTCP
jgi:hypothetical protein